MTSVLATRILVTVFAVITGTAGIGAAIIAMGSVVQQLMRSAL